MNAITTNNIVPTSIVGLHKELGRMLPDALSDAINYFHKCFHYQSLSQLQRIMKKTVTSKLG